MDSLTYTGTVERIGFNPGSSLSTVLVGVSDLSPLFSNGESGWQFPLDGAKITINGQECEMFNLILCLAEPMQGVKVSIVCPQNARVSVSEAHFTVTDAV